MLVVRQLIWDDWNTAHIARHDITLQEVEETCYSDYSIRETYGGRLLLVGSTRSGRLLAIVLASKPAVGVYYPITAHIASGKIRRDYEQERGREEAA